VFYGAESLALRPTFTLKEMDGFLSGLPSLRSQSQTGYSTSILLSPLLRPALPVACHEEAHSWTCECEPA